MRSLASSRTLRRAGRHTPLAALARFAGLVYATAALAGCGAWLCARAVDQGAAPGPCVPTGTWVVPATHERLTTPAAIERTARSRIVLLGEEHDRPEDHLWQLQTIAALLGQHAHLVIGLEMFPRSAQTALDQWVAGTVDERAFLTASGWKTFWDLPTELYLPILRFARLNRVPLRAVNVPRALVARVAAESWDSVPVQEREGLSPPAPAAPEYERWLTESYQQHVEKADGRPHGNSAGFIAAQLVWDRAFAEALQAAAVSHPDALVIGLMGSGHLQHRYGVPHQLAALGIDDVTVLLPWAASRDCNELVPDLADAVFGVERLEPARAQPLLGIAIEATDAGIAVRRVTAGSVAAAAGMRPGDVIVAAAGLAVHAPGELREIVARQAPGTWLPLRVRRGRKEIQIVARFPTEP